LLKPPSGGIQRHCEYQSFCFWHVVPQAQVVQPENWAPPHCPHFSVTQSFGEVAGGEAGGVAWLGGVEVEVGLAGETVLVEVVVGLGGAAGVEVELGTALEVEVELEVELELEGATGFGLLAPPGAATAGKLESSARLQPVRATSSAGHCTWRKEKVGLSAFLNQSKRQ
jgi:hypothetical protein